MALRMTLVGTDLECMRGGQRLFAPVGFRLAPGQALLLKGPNGAGKTTLLRALAGLGRLEAGTATLDGVPLAQADGAVALSGHLDAVKHALTVAENIGFWAALAGADPGPALGRFGLTGLAARPAGRLSAGQKRRLGLARLAVSGARVWLMDEPTVSLDAENTAALGAMIAEHLGQGGMAIIATHLPMPIEASELVLTPAVQAPEAAPDDPFLAGDMA